MKAMPKATGLFETHLTVADLDRSIEFYRDVVGLPVALEVPERGAAFLWIGGPGEAMLGLWSLGSAPIGLSLHIALTTSLATVLGACDALRSKGVTPLSFFGDRDDGTERDRLDARGRRLLPRPRRAPDRVSGDVGRAAAPGSRDHSVVGLEGRRPPRRGGSRRALHAAHAVSCGAVRGGRGLGARAGRVHRRRRGPGRSRG